MIEWLTRLIHRINLWWYVRKWRQGTITLQGLHDGLSKMDGEGDAT